MKSNTGSSLTLLIILGLIWGSGYTLAKYAMTHGVPPLGYSLWQSLGPALALTLICVVTEGSRVFQPRYWLFYGICGLIGIVIPNTNMYFIASHIPAGLLAVIVNTVPLIVYPLALLTRQERLDGWRLGALMLGMTGIVMMISPSLPPVLSFWTLLALITPIAFALCSVYIGARQPPTLTALQSASGMLLAASLFLIPLVIQQGSFYPLNNPLDTVQAVVILEIILSSIGYLVFFTLIRKAGPVFYSLTGGVVALTGLFWGWLIFNEYPSLIHGIAAACVISAIFLLSWRQAQHTKVLYD